MFRPARKRVERRGSAPGTLKVPGVENARDLGGIPTAGGLTAYHRYLRCGSTSSLSKSDVQALRAYGVSVVVDLRSKEEVAASPDSLAHRIGVRYRNIPLYSRNIHDPKLERPGDDIGELSFMRSAYLSMLANRDAVRDIMLFMAPAKHDECVLFHCAAGMDRTGVVAKGDPDLLVHLAHCCNPVAGDEIVGFITRGRGVSVHRANCPNVKGLMGHPERMIPVEWDTTGATEFEVEIVVEATDRMGLLKDVTIAIGEAGANILSAATQTSSSGVARLRFLVSIGDAGRLQPLLARVGRVPSVYDARRIMPGEGASQMKRRV